MSATLPRPARLAEWLEWQENLHPRRIDMDLARVGEVADRLGLRPFPTRVITVGGTNGKGSTALLLETLLGGRYRVGTYTSPHLQRYTERIRIDGVEVDEDSLCAACADVEQARGDTPLTYFEFGTLSALTVFARAGIEYAVLEVGMGGRLDATNILDADAAVITSIGLDHCDWLGHDREAIGREKAGILRAGQPAICADREPPASILQAAEASGAGLRLIGRDFDVRPDGADWVWRDGQGGAARFPAPADVLPDNLAAALAALAALGEPTDGEFLRGRLARFAAPGRRQVLAGPVEMVLDVGHNAEAAGVLAEWLAARAPVKRTHAVIGMLEGKPVEALAATLAPQVDCWYAGGLPQTDRGLDGERLAARLPGPAQAYPEIADALAAARAAARPGERILVCGSFYSVGAAMDAMDGQRELA